MSALHHQQVGSSDLTPSMSSEFVSDMLFGIRTSADAAEHFVQLGDPAGLDYCTIKIVAYSRQLVATVADIKQHAGGGH